MQHYPEDFVGVGPQYERTLGTVIVCLAPIAPMFASELWAGFSAAPPLARLVGPSSAAASPVDAPFDLVSFPSVHWLSSAFPLSVACQSTHTLLYSVHYTLNIRVHLIYTYCTQNSLS